VGQTADIDKRLRRHNQGRLPSTREGLPWKLVLQLPVADRSSAIKLEKR
jgi:putative endonuclease